MIMYENLKLIDVIDVVEALAYRVAHHEHPGWYEIPEEEVARILREEGIDAHVED